jgi:hypothetical protein
LTLAARALALNVTLTADARVPTQWKNCTTVDKRYPPGVGKLRAHDATDGDPVTTFKRSAALYLTAMRYNRGLDRDHDGIACEEL